MSKSIYFLIIALGLVAGVRAVKCIAADFQHLQMQRAASVEKILAQAE